jgi:hypothetical protein
MRKVMTIPMMMKTEEKMMPVRYYYSINDMLRYASPNIEVHEDTETEYGDIHCKGSSAFLTDAYCIYELITQRLTSYDMNDLPDECPEIFGTDKNENIRDRFFRKMIDRTFNNTVAISDHELDWSLYPVEIDEIEWSINSEEAAKNFIAIFGGYLARLAQFFDSTYKRYALILSAYENKLDTYQKALARVGSDSTHETRFNDTPQDTATPAADTHLTTYTKDTTESSSDMSTIMTRISELEAKMSDVYKNWTDEYINQFSVI